MAEAVEHIRASEERRTLEEAKRYIPEVEVGAYTCLCAACGKTYQSDNKRSAYCGC